MSVTHLERLKLIPNGHKEQLTFSDAEMERRLSVLRNIMADDGVDVALLISYHNVKYFSDFLYTSFGRPYAFVVTAEDHFTVSANIDAGMPWPRKEWPLQSITVSLRHSRIHSTDCADCATQTGQLDRVDRTIRLTGGLDDDQRRRLLEIADRCPVHRTLHSEVNVRTTLALDDTLPVVAEVPTAGAPA